jgi:type I restriction enzyme S subunit
MIDHIWPTQVLGENNVAAISSGGTPSRTHPEYFNGGIMWVKSGDLNDSCLFETSETISELGLKQSAAKLLPPNTVLIAMYGATVGKTALLKHEAATNQAVCTIQPNPSIYNPLFLQYLLILLRQHLLNERYGGAQPNISQTIIRNLELPCPKVNEQESIAAVLWKVQRAIEVEEKLTATARELKQAAMRQLFSRGLRGEAQQETEIGPIPDGWSLRPLAELREFLQYGTSAKCEYEKQGNPVLRIPNILDGDIDVHDLKWCKLSDKEVASWVLEQGDVLFIRTNGVRDRVGTCAVYHGQPERSLFASYLIRARLKTDKLNPDYFQYFSNTPVGRAQLAGRASPAADGKFNVNTKNIDAVLIPVPKELEEQREIVNILQVIDRKIGLHERKRASMQELFQALLHKLMTGEIRVADLDIDVSEVTQ